MVERYWQCCRARGVSLRELALEVSPGADGVGSTGQALRASFVRDDLPDFAHTLAQLSAAAQGFAVVLRCLWIGYRRRASLGSSAPALAAVDADLAAAGLHVVRYRQSGLCLTIYLPTVEIAAATRRSA